MALNNKKTHVDRWENGYQSATSKTYPTTPVCLILYDMHSDSVSTLKHLELQLSLLGRGGSWCYLTFLWIVYGNLVLRVANGRRSWKRSIYITQFLWMEWQESKFDYLRSIGTRSLSLLKLLLLELVWRFGLTKRDCEGLGFDSGKVMSSERDTMSAWRMLRGKTMGGKVMSSCWDVHMNRWIAWGDGLASKDWA